MTACKTSSWLLNWFWAALRMPSTTFCGAPLLSALEATSSFCAGKFTPCRYCCSCPMSRFPRFGRSVLILPE